jgi:aspartate/methionine/tyrosine aminotransferase
MKPSLIREIFDLALLRDDTVCLHVGEPDFPTPGHVLEAAAAAAAAGFTRYTANRGLLSLRESIRRKLLRVNGYDVDPEQIVVTSGGVNALFETFTALLEPGDEILVPDPAWPNYVMGLEAIGAVPVGYRLERELDFEPDLENLARLARRPRAKVLLVNSPSNPTGAVFRRSTLERCLELAREHDLWLVSDEVYDEIVFEGEHWSPATADEDGRVISVYSVSKTYAMTGWRVGWIVAPPELAVLLAKLQEPVISSAVTPAQKAAEAALDGPQDCVAMMREAYRARRDLAVDLLEEHDLLAAHPHGAFYVLADVSRATGPATIEFARSLVLEHGVAVGPGETFGPGAAGCVRLSLAADQAAIAEGVRRIAHAVDYARVA